jgi:hypothetical protein
MFEKYYRNLRSVIIAAEKYRPLPMIDERGEWESLPHELSEKLVLTGEKYLGYGWPPILATDFMDYARTGSRKLLDKITIERREALIYLTLAECVENRGRFIDSIINGVWATCDEATWIISAHNQMYPLLDETAPQLPETTERIKIFVDIISGDVGSLMATVYYLVGTKMDNVSHSVNRRLLKNLDERILTPFLINDDFPWMGAGRGFQYINNWTIWILSNVLAVTALTVTDAEKRARIIEKVLYYTDRFLAYFPDDGSYPEGSGYWMVACASLLYGLELIKGMTGGVLDFLAEEKIKALTMFICKMHIDGEMFVNYGDADLKIPSASACRLYSMSELSENIVLRQFAIAMHHKNDADLMPDQRHLAFAAVRELFAYKRLVNELPIDFPHLRDSWYNTVEVMCARETQGVSKGLYFSAKGGTAFDSHCHIDVGTFIIYSDGMPAVIDMGRGDYNFAAFGPERHKVKSISSEWHNVPFIRGHGQYLNMSNKGFSDAQFYRAKNVSYTADGILTELSMDLKDVYPGECGIESWKRIFRFDRRKKEIVVSDEFSLANHGQDTCLCMVTANKPIITGPCSIRIPVNGGRNIAATFIEGLHIEVDELQTKDDKRLSETWGDALWRIRLFIDKGLTKNAISVVFRQEGENKC